MKLKLKKKKKLVVIPTPEEKIVQIVEIEEKDVREAISNNKTMITMGNKTYLADDVAEFRGLGKRPFRNGEFTKSFIEWHAKKDNVS